jgi:hypothetical protein
VEEKTGGLCVYVNGAIGGLITTDDDVAVRHPESGKEISKASFEKAEAQGMQLADIAYASLQNSNDSIHSAAISLNAKTFVLPFKNKYFRLGALLGVINRGMTGKWQVRTEMAAWNIGSASFLTIPGEIYPEIVNGGVETPEGQDFEIPVQETPPLRDVMTGKYKFVFGMANDELGYFIPKSQWDNEAPWTYGNKELYGEINSLGPETAPIIHRVGMEIINELNQ